MRHKLLFDKINIIEFDDWPVEWLTETEMGQILEGSERTYGLLCTDDIGTFILLDQEQMYNQKVIPWPDHTKDIPSIVINGNQVNIGPTI